MEINSNKIIEREYQGYKWFFNNIVKEKNMVEIKRNSFNALIIPEFQGVKYINERKFHLQKDSMLKIVNYYKKMWPTNKNFAIHGDMGLSNFIINGDEIILIDWEHFHNCDLRFYGFDIINMLFISFYYRINSQSFIGKEKYFIKDLYKILFDDIKFECSIINRPFYESKKYIINYYRNHNNYNTLIENKFVLASFSDESLNRLDHFVTS